MREARQVLLRRLQKASEVFRISLDREESLWGLTPEPFSEAGFFSATKVREGTEVVLYFPMARTGGP